MKPSEKFTQALCLILGCTSDDIKPEDTWASLGADNLDVVEIIMALEDAYVVAIDDIRFDACSTIQEVSDYVEALKPRA